MARRHVVWAIARSPQRYRALAKSDRAANARFLLGMGAKLILRRLYIRTALAQLSQGCLSLPVQYALNCNLHHLSRFFREIKEDNHAADSTTDSGSELRKSEESRR